MIITSEEVNVLKLQFRSVIEKTFNAAPPESCKLTFRDGDDLSNVIADIEPFDSYCAPIDARLLCNYGVVLKVGRGAVFELPLKGRRYTKLEFNKELELLCTAVIEGHFLETVDIVDGEIVGAIGRIDVPDVAKPVKDAWAKIGKTLFRKKTRVQYSYSPYHSPS